MKYLSSLMLFILGSLMFWFDFIVKFQGSYGTYTYMFFVGCFSIWASIAVLTIKEVES